MAKFQSTLPVRGATSIKFSGSFHPSISIHAPRTGSDGAEQLCGHRGPISIHAPRTGSDLPGIKSRKQFQISIHAPRTGSDMVVENLWQ